MRTKGIFTRVGGSNVRQTVDVSTAAQIAGGVKASQFRPAQHHQIRAQGTAPPFGIQVFARAWANGLMVRAIGDADHPVAATHR